jgi:pre-rRNA-processing protein TSR2
MASSSAQAPQTGATPEQKQSYFELGIALSISLWPALKLAVDNQWGGPDSADKRDWFAGAIVTDFTERPETDALDVEDRLLQVMNDEFDVNVEDDSAQKVAEQIMRIKKACGEGDFKEVEELRERWQKGGKGKGGPVGTEVMFQRVERNDDEDETDWDSDDIPEEDEDEDDEMTDAPAPAQRREKTPPQVDEDGFTTVRRTR